MSYTQITPREYSDQDTQQLLWQLLELSFRFELLMLDRRATAATAQRSENEREREKLMSPLTRELDVLKMLPCLLESVHGSNQFFIGLGSWPKCRTEN